MAELEVYTLFCEDIRWEVNGAPILLGVMSPIFYASEFPVKFNKLFLVTFFRSESERENFEVELDVKKSITKDFEDIESAIFEDLGVFTSKFDKDDSDLGPQWAAISTLPLEDIELEEGQSLSATIKVYDIVKTTYLTAVKSPQEGNEGKL